MSITVMKQALEALDDNQHLIAEHERHAYVMHYNRICEALRQAIEQAENVEPVAASGEDLEIYKSIARGYFATHPPTAPAQKGCPVLCELCIKRGYSECVNVTVTTPLPTAPAQPSITDECGRPMTYWGGKAAPAQPSNHTEQPLDMVKAQEPLTDDQIYEMYSEPCSDAEMIAFARAIEQAHGIKGASL